jgi:hypothetical protein
MIKIELTNEDADLFKDFRKYQDDFTVMLSNGVFNFKNGSCIIHRDNDGKIRKIEINKISFKE